MLFVVGCVSRVQIKQGSIIMAPTIQRDEVITADVSAFRKTHVQRWDVVIFLRPFKTEDATEFWGMRVVGLPGESISITEEGVYADGKLLTQPERIRDIRYLTGEELQPVVYPRTVPPKHYFVLGDNTAIAHDSRFWGVLHESRIMGKVIGK